MNMRVTNVDLGSVEAGNIEHRDDVLALAAASTVAEGTILARHTGGTTPSNKLVPYEKGGVEGKGVPVAVLGYEVIAAAAGDVAVRPIVAGRVRKERLVIAAGGTVNHVELDGLRDFGIVAIDVAELNTEDNQ